MHRFAICVGLLLAACAGAAPLPPKAIQLNDQGTQALAEGDLETASARFEVALEYIEEDEYVEVTPASIRLRKILLKEAERRRQNRAV